MKIKTTLLVWLFFLSLSQQVCSDDIESVVFSSEQASYYQFDGFEHSYLIDSQVPDVLRRQALLIPAKAVLSLLITEFPVWFTSLSVYLAYRYPALYSVVYYSFLPVLRAQKAWLEVSMAESLLETKPIKAAQEQLKNWMQPDLQLFPLNFKVLEP